MEGGLGWMEEEDPFCTMPVRYNLKSCHNFYQVSFTKLHSPLLLLLTQKL